MRSAMTWWESWFGEEYLDLYPHRDLEAARREAAFALAHLPSPPCPVLDLCCGTGRHSIPLAEAGAPPVGLDYSAPLLDLARRRDRHTLLVRGDMRALPFQDASFRTVVNFFTSFGYFRTESENRMVVEEIERVLQPGGAFLCDTFGRDHVLARLVPEERCSRGGKEYRIRRSWDSSTSRLEKEIEVCQAGSSETFRESVRAYSPAELIAMLERAGLCIGSVWGDLDESPVGPDSPRLIVLARKTEKAS
ncbi:MAG TPA: class I SAM-dependent methyltransferase [Thermoanaerobaculia bacterium]|nr:class I SAM-dependent methyltransferase [Thermoanaerobaculia bacterium]